MQAELISDLEQSRGSDGLPILRDVHAQGLLAYAHSIGVVPQLLGASGSALLNQPVSGTGPAAAAHGEAAAGGHAMADVGLVGPVGLQVASRRSIDGGRTCSGHGGSAAIQHENMHPNIQHPAIKQEAQESTANGFAANGPGAPLTTAGTATGQRPLKEQQPQLPVPMDTTQADASMEPPHGDAAATIAAARQALQGARQVLQDILSHPQPPQVTPAAQNGPPWGGAAQASGVGGSTQAAAPGPSQAPAAGGPQAAGAGAAAAGGGSSSGNSKGLRQFALMVCEQVRERGRTTYNEVADVLVKQLSADASAAAAAAAGEGGGGGGGGGKDVDKTIRRRVYDAINVLLAMDIIQREKKDILWKGLPTIRAPGTTTGAGAQGAAASGAPGHQQQGNGGPPMSAEVHELLAERQRLLDTVDRKQSYLQELVDQHESLQQLVERNSSNSHQSSGTAIHLPFILIQARPGATVEVNISEDMHRVQFDFFDSPIQVHDDSSVVRQLVRKQQQQRAQQQGEEGHQLARSTGTQQPFAPMAAAPAQQQQLPSRPSS